MYQCTECDFQCEKFGSIKNHCRKQHGFNAKQTYDEVILHGIIPTCACGCGEIPKFWSTNGGYMKFVHGHNARGKGNPTFGTKRPDNVRKKSSETKRRKFESGETVAWNVGLTKKTDERVALYGIRGSETIRLNEDELDRRAERMRSNRLDGTIPTLVGSDHSQWKGGTSSISALVSTHKRFYEEWKLPKFHKNNFTCQRCGMGNNLSIHHNEKRMADIIHECVAMFLLDNPEHTIKTIDTFEIKKEIMENVIDYHINNNVSGEVICIDCHKKEHPSYNFTKLRKTNLVA